MQRSRSRRAGLILAATFGLLAGPAARAVAEDPAVLTAAASAESTESTESTESDKRAENDRLRAELPQLAKARRWDEIIERGRAALAAESTVGPPATAICHLGLAYEARNNLPLANAYLDWCGELGDGPAEAGRALERARAAADASERAPVAFIGAPAGAVIALDGELEGHRLLLVRELWLHVGEHRGTISAAGHESRAILVQVSSRARLSVMVPLRPLREAEPKIETVDFAEEAGPDAAEAMAVKDPKPTQHASLLPDRYQRGVTAALAAPAATEAAPRRALQPFLAVGVGALISTGGEASALVELGAGLSVPLGARLSLAPAVAVFWQSGEGDGDDAAGLSAGATLLFAALPRWGLALGLAADAGATLGQAPRQARFTVGPVLSFGRGPLRAHAGARLR